jgi:serine/threonine protein kinase/tetratricopeptide (TPR) repeat protein
MIGNIFHQRYKIESEIGHGGVGTVYSGHDTVLDRDIAIKVLNLNSEPCLGAENCARLLEEARTAAKLNHPNIVSVFDAGEEKDSSFIIMELMEGQSLHEDPPKSIDETIAIAKQICLALGHAHENGIIHRDLKPENVIITPEGTAKLTDFGLAQSIATRLTSEGVIVGTVFYMAPELAMGQDYDGRVDLYSLGVMLYELTTGRLPFTAEDPLAVISQHLHAPVVPPRTFRPDLPRGLEAIILKLLAKNPNDRFTDPEQVVTALEQFSTEDDAQLPLGVGESIESIALLEQLSRGRLIGRQKQIEQLKELWAHTQSGHLHMALISGEPGIGKTRLANELMVYAQLSGAVVLRGGCYEYEATMPYVPLVEALRAWVRGQNADQLNEKLGSMATELSKLAPEIEAKVGPLSPNPPLAPDEERLRLFDNVARFLARLSNGGGLLLFIDDLHWADQGTLTLLYYLLRNLRSQRMMILAAYREVELTRSHPLAAALVEWNRERLATRVSIGRFNQDETCALLCSLFEIESVSDEFVEAIHSETEGNPFFIEEVIKALIGSGQIYRVGDRWEREEITSLAIPQSVKEAIGRRLTRLNPTTIDVLHSAAPLGKSFNFSELASVVSLDENQLLDVLDEAISAQIIQVKSGEDFIFTHDNIREVLYEELNPIRRRRMHQRIGESLEVIYASDLIDHYPDLAYHFIESGDLSRGLSYSIQAAEKAQSIYALDEALYYYERGAECADTLELPDKLKDIYEAMGKVYYLNGPFQKAVELFQSALDLAADDHQRAELKTWIGMTYAYVGDEAGLEYLNEAIEGLDAETQGGDLARATAMLGRYHHYHGQSKKAIEYLETARQLAEPLDDPSILTEIYAYLSGAYQQSIPPQIQRSDEWAQRSIAMGERLNHPHAVAIGYEFLAENASINGKWEECLQYANRDREIGEKIGSQGRLTWAEFLIALALNGKGELPKALKQMDTALALTERIGDQRLAALIRSWRTVTETDLGLDEAAAKDAEFVLARATETGQFQQKQWSLFSRSYIHTQHEQWDELLQVADEQTELTGTRPIGWYVEAYLGKGELDEINTLLEGSGDVNAQIANQPFQNQAAAWRQQGRFLAATGGEEQAIELLDRSITTFEELSSSLNVGRSLHYRAQIYHDMGERDHAKSDFKRALEIFEACGAKPDLEKTRALISTLELQI